MKVEKPMPIEYDKAKLQWALNLLTMPVDIAIAPEDEDGQWVALSRQIYVAAAGNSPHQALRSWHRCFLPDLLLHLMITSVLPKATPDDAWAEMTARSGVWLCDAIHQVRVHDDHINIL